MDVSICFMNMQISGDCCRQPVAALDIAIKHSLQKVLKKKRSMQKNTKVI